MCKDYYAQTWLHMKWAVCMKTVTMTVTIFQKGKQCTKSAMDKWKVICQYIAELEALHNTVVMSRKEREKKMVVSQGDNTKQRETGYCTR